MNKVVRTLRVRHARSTSIISDDYQTFFNRTRSVRTTS